VYYERNKLKAENVRVTRKCAKYRQRYYRQLSEKTKNRNSPRSKIAREFT
jgi:hypothetical protein